MQHLSVQHLSRQHLSIWATAVTDLILTKLQTLLSGTIFNRCQLSLWHLSILGISQLLLTWFLPNFLDTIIWIIDFIWSILFRPNFFGPKYFLNQIGKTKPTKPSQTYQTKLTQSNLRNQTFKTYKTNPNVSNLPNQTYYTKLTKPNQSPASQSLPWAWHSSAPACFTFFFFPILWAEKQLFRF